VSRKRTVYPTQLKTQLVLELLKRWKESQWNSLSCIRNVLF